MVVVVAAGRVALDGVEKRRKASISKKVVVLDMVVKVMMVHPERCKKIYVETNKCNVKGRL